jgi:hypothetical protein
MLVQPRIIQSDGVYALASWQNAMIIDVAGNMDLQHMMRVGRAYRELILEYPDGIASFCMIRPGVPVAPADARDESARFTKELGNSLLKVTILIEDTGILAQMMQTVIRGINVLSRNPKLIPLRSIDEAVDIIAPLVVPTEAGANVPSELREAIHFVRSGYSPRAANKQPSVSG